MHCTRAAVVFIFLLGTLSAQHTLPGGRDGIDAPSLGQFAGASAHLRQQVLISESHLQPLVGQDLTAIWFRRDFSYTGPLEGAATDLSVRLSITSTDPNAPSEEFASNLGSGSQLVFDGSIAIPTSSKLSSQLADWAQENTLRIVLDTPFTYTGGTLVVDITGQPQPGAASSFWPVDMDYLVTDGQAHQYGQGCGSYAISSIVSEPGLEIGATAFFGAWGAPNSLGFLLLGTPLPSALDLSAMGATGCSAYIDSLFNFPTMFSDEIMGSGVGGARVDIHVPADLSLLGATLHSQWVNLEIALPVANWSNPIGLTTSNATRFTIGTMTPSLGMSTITSAIPPDGQAPADTGYVEVNKGPVLRFLYQ